ncbi:MAG TPA: zinc ribbon domain-containing protein [Planctomycetota bacterium]|nr:zinc ribbon domain-containing protein [Planctomycetota bacterium]
MPIYTYRAVLEPREKRRCEMCANPFEIVQRMADDALTACPKCGGIIERVIQAPNLNGAGKVKAPSEGQLARSGFTQYKKKGKGYYEKSFGTGPSTLHP